MHGLEEKVVVITGAGRGIGRAMALAFADHGSRVVVNDSGGGYSGQGHDPNVAANVVADIVGKGQQALANDEDVSAPGATQRLAEAALNAYGRVDVAIHCAGIWQDGSLTRMSDAEFDAVVGVQLGASFRFTRDMAGAIHRSKGGGCILLCAGPAGLFGNPRQANLAAAEGGVVALAKTAAQEFARQQIRVNVIAPTARTRLTEQLPLFQSIRDDSLTVEHVCPPALFLASDAARDITGEVVGVAGGRIYSFRTVESTGLFNEGGPVDVETLQREWRSVTRG